MAGLVLLFVVVAFIAATKTTRPFLINPSPSMPVGLYELRSVDRPVATGDTVVLCPPASFAAIGIKRHYLGGGPCGLGSEALLKLVAGVAGDRVSLAPGYVAINGRCLALSATMDEDRQKRALPHFPQGSFVLLPHQIWLWAPSAHSLDSRYFGPLDARTVLNFASPLIVQPSPAMLSYAEPCPAASP